MHFQQLDLPGVGVDGVFLGEVGEGHGLEAVEIGAERFEINLAVDAALSVALGDMLVRIVGAIGHLDQDFDVFIHLLHIDLAHRLALGVDPFALPGLFNLPQERAGGLGVAEDVAVDVVLGFELFAPDEPQQNPIF